MTQKELLETKGGASINATFINAIARGIDTCYNLGKAFGSAIRRIVSRSKCI